MNDFGSRRPLPRCEAHGLHFDPALAAGCTLCVGAQVPRGGHPGIALGAIMAVPVAALSILAWHMWVRDDEARPAAVPSPVATLEQAPVSIPVATPPPIQGKPQTVPPIGGFYRGGLGPRRGASPDEMLAWRGACERGEMPFCELVAGHCIEDHLRPEPALNTTGAPSSVPDCVLAATCSDPAALLSTLCDLRGVAAACAAAASAHQRAGDKTSARRYAEKACDAQEPNGCYVLASLVDDPIARRTIQHHGEKLSVSGARGAALAGTLDWRESVSAETAKASKAEMEREAKLHEETGKWMATLAERQRAIDALPHPSARLPYEWPPRSGGACGATSDCNSPFLACGPDGTCVEDRATRMARELGVRPSTYQPPRPRTPEELARLFEAGGLPRDANGIRAPGVTLGGYALYFDPNKPRQPTDGLGSCLQRTQICLANDQDPSKTLDSCVASLPRCTTATPWLGNDPAGADCCPSACIESYFEERKTSGNASAARIFSESGCYPGVPPRP